MKISKLHKTLLALLAIFTPAYFLLFTDDGTRVSDNFLLWVMGEKQLEFNLKEADAQFTQGQILEIFKELDWQCQDQRSAFGTQLCGSTIGTFNEYPSRYLTLFFAHNHLTAMKLVYRRHYHDQLLGHLITTLGQPRNVAEAVSGTPDAATVLEWDTGKGLVVLQKELDRKASREEAALMWLAHQN